jgi:hypothetical protein
MISSTSGFLAKAMLWPYVSMPGVSYTGERPALTDEQYTSKERMTRHVHVLAHEIGERHSGCYRSLQAARGYIQTQFESYGYKPKAHLHLVDDCEMFNIEAVLPGKLFPEINLIIGAHYDSYPGSPGANDNGSGDAGLLELAYQLASVQFPITIRFVAFVNEEHCNLPAETMGSFAYVKYCWENGFKINGMMALETIASYSNELNSQKYPWPFSLLFPSTANFVGFIGNRKSRQFIRHCVGLFRENAKFSCEGLAAPWVIRDAGRSDHFFFQRFGYPALMVTDTANFRYQHYHTKDDTADKLDYDGLTLVVDGLKRVICHLAKNKR